MTSRRLERGSNSPTTDSFKEDTGTVDTADNKADTIDTQHQVFTESPQRVWPAIPGYEILGELGRGGMGQVYRARQTKLKRQVALKMIRGGDASEVEIARFRTEAEAVARLQDPGIVQIHEIGEHAGSPFLALEFVEGGTLAKRLQGEPQPPKAAAEMVGKISRAMHAAHTKGIVHRDLKPANILVTADGIPKVSDFGLARFADSDSGHTRTGQVMGTPSYMAPEQAAGRTKELGPLVDVYALGAILYEMLTGMPPFKGVTVLDTLEQVRTKEPLAPSQLLPKLPRDLETICLKCLQKDRQKRYASAEHLANDLSRFDKGEPIEARPVGRIERGWRWCKRNPLAASFLLTLGFAAVITSSLALWALGEKDRADGNAKAAADHAREANENASRASDNAVEANRNANAHRRALANFCTARGLEAWQNRRASLGFVWFAEALLQSPSNSAQQDADLARLELHWALPDRCHLSQVLVHDSSVYRAYFSQDQQRIVTVSDELCLWDRATGSRLATVANLPEHGVNQTDYLDHARWTRLGFGLERTMGRWSLQNLKERWPSIQSTTQWDQVSISKDSEMVVTAGKPLMKDPEIHVWDTRTGKCSHGPIRLFNQSGIPGLALSGDKNRLLLSTSRNALSPYLDLNKKSTHEGLPAGMDFTLAEFSPNGRYVAMADRQRQRQGIRCVRSTGSPPAD